MHCNLNLKPPGGFSQTATHALYHLAEHPELVAPLRDEIETCIAADGWTGTALGNMWKLDSLLREILRFYGVGMCKYHANPHPLSPIHTPLVHIHRADFALGAHINRNRNRNRAQ